MARILRDTVTKPRKARRALQQAIQDWRRTVHWLAKQRAADPGRYYGGTGTIHGSTLLDVEVHNGQVVSVWFRCQPLAFRQLDVDDRRAEEMIRMAEQPLPAITGVEVDDAQTPAVQAGF